MKTHLVLGSLLAALLTVSAAAQSIVTFEAIETPGSTALTLDSIYVVHMGTGRDTTVIGSAQFDLGTLSGVALVPERATTLLLGIPTPTVFDARTAFEVSGAVHETVHLRVYALDGRCLAAWSGELSPGTARFELEADGFSAGMYVVTASSASGQSLRKVLKRGAATGTTRVLRLAGVLGARDASMLARTAAETWTFIGYASGHQPDTLADVAPRGGDRLTFLLAREPAGMKLRMGRSIEVGSYAVPVGGRSVVVDAPASRVHGLELRVPAGAHTEARDYAFSYADIPSHALGAGVRVITPMIQIRNGGGYADEVIEIRIPCTIARDEFAMGFFFNERTGAIEGLLLLDEDSTGITVGTRHFGPSVVSGTQGLRGSVGGMGGFRRAEGGAPPSVTDWAGAVGNMFVASVKSSFLSQTQTVSTGYAVKQDDWEFPNYGSFISPGGHCAGQSITSMWYYYEKRLAGAAPLYHRYDRFNREKDSLWCDNPRGYKLASVIQEDLRWDSWLRDRCKTLGDSAYHTLGFKALLAAMVLTGEPQYLRVSGKDGGHAIVAFKVNTTDSTVIVADPNFPGQERSVVLRNGYFEPYNSMLNADDADNVVFTDIGYMAKTAMIDWHRIAPRWAEFEAGTIGTVAPNTFPTVEIRTRMNDPLTNGMKVFGDTLELYFIPNGVPNDSLGFNCWNDNLHKRTLPQGAILLQQGDWDYGFLVLAKKKGKYRFVDFRWVRINSARPVISVITPSTVKPDSTILIKGIDFGTDRTKSAVMLGTLELTDISEWTDTTIRVRVPATAKSGYVIVRREKAESNRKFLNVDVPVTITSVTPLNGHWNDVVTIRGTSLSKVMYVRFNGHLSPDMPPNAPGWSDSVIVARVPNSCVSGPVTLHLIGKGDTIMGPMFSQDSVLISSISPPDGKMNTIVEIYGEHFGQASWPGSKVMIGGQVASPILSWSDTKIVIYGSNSGFISVTVCGKTVRGPFFYMIP